MNKIKHIREFGTIWDSNDFTNPVDTFNDIYLDAQSFENLKNFVAENTDPQTEVEVAFSYHRKKGKDFIRVKNYVGVIETRNGTTIEVLPKIYSSESDEVKASRRVLLKMLRCLKNSPFKSIDQAHINSTKVPILEVFISLFLREVEEIVKRGIKHYYTNYESNQRFLKGQLVFSEHIRLNAVRSDRFYVRFDEFLANIPQNRILKSALNYLLSKSNYPKNKRQIIDYLTLFEEINCCKNVVADFNKVDFNNRLNSYYTKALKWARLFLEEKSFSSYRGKHLNTALLFPMEVLFEAYVANRIKKQYPEFEISTQDRQHYLLTDMMLNRKKFRIRPDMVARNEERMIVLDTKWKIINENHSNKTYSIALSDLYQLYAYGKKYEADDLILIFPYCSTFTKKLEFAYEENLKLTCVPWNFQREEIEM